MPPEITKAELQEVGQAVEELRKEVKSGSIDKEKMDRINVVLDSHEEKSQQITQAAARQEAQEAEIKELRESLEKKGAEAGEIRTQVEALELELARRSDPSVREGKAYKTSDEYKAVQEFCIKGEARMPDETKQYLRTDSDAEGGVLVPTELDNEITKRIVEIDGIRSIARVRSVAAKSLTMPKRLSIPTAAYEGEAEEGPDSTSLYDATTVTPFRQTFSTPITLDLLQDAAFDMESEIMEDAGEAFAFGEGNGFVLGSGHKQPEGFVAKASIQAGARDTAASGVLDPEAIILLTGDLKVGYNPTYVLNRRTLALIRTFRGDAASPGDEAGQFLWQPGLNGPVSNTINGFPYILANSMPDVAAGAFPIAFGDFRRGYSIIDRTGLAVVRDEFALKKKAQVEFTMHRWNTGQVVLDEAIKLLRVLP